MKKIYNFITASLLVLLMLTPGRTSAQCSTPNTAPYYEGFNGITANNQLPACWAASNMSVTCLTYTGTGGNNGSNAAFYYSPAGVNYFYSHSIQLYAGVTYSASVWYNTGSTGGANWTDLSLLYGTSQSGTGLTGIASTGGPASSIIYHSLTNTFMVPASGVYYIAVRGTSTNGPAQYLYFDDLFITIPCSLNSPTLSVTGNSVLCSGQPATFTASSTYNYTWSANGTTSNTPVFTFTPNAITNAIYITAGSTLTGCTTSVTQQVLLHASPQISIFTQNPNHSVCPGNPITLYALPTSNNTYTWTGMPQGDNATYTPTINTTYTVTGTNSYGCTAIQLISITIAQLPVVSCSSSQPTICAGESVKLIATGADNYTWVPVPNAVNGASATISPIMQTTYIVTGLDLVTGCTNTASVVQHVSQCTGISKVSNGSVIAVYPNPTNGLFTLCLNTSAAKTIAVSDITGRIILSKETSEETIDFNLSDFANGIYYLKVRSNEETGIAKIIKQ